MSRAVLICGATGKQGGSVIRNLLQQKTSYEILAVTRDAKTPSATRLLNLSPKIKLVQGNLAQPAEIFKTAKGLTKSPIWGVFSVQSATGGSGGGELGQGKGLVDAAVDAGAQFFVYTSVDRHGEASIDNPTNVPHFVTKHQIEHHLIERSKESGMEWAILRPVAFMENFTDDFFGRVFATSWKMALKGKPLQLVGVSDIGFFGARALLHPDEFKNRALSLAGDELTIDQVERVFKATTGSDLKGTYGFICWLLMWAVKDFGLMIKWFHDVGYAANVPELKKMHPGLKDFETWLKTESQFAKAAKP